MGIKTIYFCDICRDEIKNPVDSFGICFSNLTEFTLGGYGSTDGLHICYRCAKQLQKELSKINIAGL